MLAVLLVGGAGAWWWVHRPSSLADADPAAITGERAATGPKAPASAAGGGRRFGGGNASQPVSVMAARRQDIRVILSAVGNIAALNTATVRTHVDGDLKAIHFKEGQPVRAGALLAEIDPRNYEIQLAQAQGQLARDVAQLHNAQVDLERYKDLLAKDSIAKQQVQTQDALVQQLVGTVQTDKAQVDSAKLQLSYTKVTAPISGRLGLKQVDLGNMVHASDSTGLISITQTQPIAMVFAVPEANLRQISNKLKAGQPMVVEAWDREQKIKLAVGKVSSTDNAIDMATGTIKLKAEFPNSDNALFPNQFVNIRLQVDALSDVLVVPASAVQRGAQGTFVYVVKDDGSVTIRRVRLGTTEGDWVSVQGDLAAGERVVIDGADRLREGAKVEVIAPAPRATGVGAGAAGGAAPAKDDARRESRPAQNAASAPAGSRAVGAVGAASAAMPQAPTESAGASERPRWMDRLPPELLEKVMAMNPEDRRAYLQKLRDRRQQREGQ
jgi:multidrug efflux system membrane fusion protein